MDRTLVEPPTLMEPPAYDFDLFAVFVVVVALLMIAGRPFVTGASALGADLLSGGLFTADTWCFNLLVSGLCSSLWKRKGRTLLLCSFSESL